jgi:peptide/nickel transport system substrate-binding protein
MTKILWAYPDNPEDMFPYDETGETSKALFLEAGYKYDEANNVMTYPDGHEKAGTQVTFKFTLPSEAKDHPAGSIFIDTQAVLEKIGVKVDIETDQNLLGKLSTAYESGIQVWAAAWGSGGVDPDMFQIWHSDPKVNQGTSAARSGLYYLFENGSDEEKAMLNELNDLIMAGRSTIDTEERKAIYKRALELSTGLAVEVPTYQRKNMYVYNKEVINTDTLFSGDDVTPFQSPLSFIWNVELN